MSTEIEIKDAEDIKNNEEETDSTNTSLMSLLPEMLVKIMDQLSSTDRAQCRLVSRELNHFTGALYDQKERICITRLYNDCLNEVWSTLTRSARSLLHLEYRHLILADADDGQVEAAFWRVCGPKILSLKLNWCRGTHRTFVYVLRHCSHLQTLEFRYPSVREMMSGDGLSITCLRECIQLGLQNASLRNLNICFEDEYGRFSDLTAEKEVSLYYLEALCQLFNLFPSVSNFSSSQHVEVAYSCFRSNLKRVDEDKATSEYVAKLHEYFARNQMERIAVPCLGLEWDEWTSFMRVLSTKTTKITEIIITDLEDWTWESFSGFVSRQTNLEKVICVFAKSKYTKEEFEEAAHRFVTLLQNVSSVRHLELISHIFLLSEILRTIGSANDVLVRGEKSLNRPKSFPILAKLISCKIEVSSLIDSKETVATMLGAFPNLKHLHLGHANKDVLKSVSINQLKLESFIVDYVDGEDSLPSENFIDQFRNLKFLEVPQRLNLRPQNLNNLKVIRVVRPRTCLPPLKFPKFRSVFLPVHLLRSRSKVDHLPMMSRNLVSYQSACPRLEVAYFELDCYCIVKDGDGNLFGERLNDNEEASTRKVLPAFVADLKNLKYLYLTTYGRSPHHKITSTAEDLSTIFQQSRSLRVLVLAEDEIYFKHAIKNRVIRVTMKDLDIRATEFPELFITEDKKIFF